MVSCTNTNSTKQRVGSIHLQIVAIQIDVCRTNRYNFSSLDGKVVPDSAAGTNLNDYNSQVHCFKFTDPMSSKIRLYELKDQQDTKFRVRFPEFSLSLKKCKEARRQSKKIFRYIACLYIFRNKIPSLGKKAGNVNSKQSAH